jgi:hypothetical protein
MNWRTNTLAVALGALAATAVLPAQAQVDRLGGTWECRGPGQTHALKPPIMWFGDSSGNAATIEVDGFAGDVVGSAEVATEADGALRITVKQGQTLVIRNVNDAGSKVSMNLRREGVGDYRCHRLPRFDTPMIPRERTI